MHTLKSIKEFFGMLSAKGVTKVERHSEIEFVKEIRGPVLDYKCNSVCLECRIPLLKKTVSKYAFANGF